VTKRKAIAQWAWRLTGLPLMWAWIVVYSEVDPGQWPGYYPERPLLFWGGVLLIGGIWLAIGLAFDLVD